MFPGLAKKDRYRYCGGFNGSRGVRARDAHFQPSRIRSDYDLSDTPAATIRSESMGLSETYDGAASRTLNDDSRLSRARQYYKNYICTNPRTLERLILQNDRLLFVYLFATHKLASFEFLIARVLGNRRPGKHLCTSIVQIIQACNATQRNAVALLRPRFCIK